MKLDDGRDATPIGEFKFCNYDGVWNGVEAPASGMYHLTCKNHQDEVYYTKNPFERSLHLVKRPNIKESEWLNPSGECKCAFTNLVVIEEAECRCQE